ncbi:hypothetical protein SDC9_146342 [bioreactor metagenome]|uniref:Uncharacterized protein n=1 Tax=bioreactor metagenome TaxID=1076179 RepID=A0A645ECS8_9ZZZZ
MLQNVFTADFGMTGMRYEEYIVETAEKFIGMPIVQRMRKNSKRFARQIVFGHAIMVVKTSLCCPTDVKGRINMSFAPFKNFCKFLPVINFFKGHLFHRCSGNDHSVVTAVADVSK